MDQSKTKIFHGFFFVFVAFLCLFLYLANLVIYDAVSAVFYTSPSSHLSLLIITLSVLSLSFVFSFILGMRFYNWFTRIYYYIASVWLGFFFYFFFASILLGLIFSISYEFFNLIGKPLLALVFIIGIYGILHARKITIKEIAIRIENLPEAWLGRKIIWISDIHLGQIYGADFAEKIVNQINEIPHDILFIGGDLFDGTGAPDIDELIAPFKKLNTNGSAYFITGNHEEFGDNQRFLNAVRGAGIKTLVDEVIEIDGVQIIGVDYKNSIHKDNFRNVLLKLNLDKSKPSILLKHEPKDLEVGEEVGIDLQISGHTHRAQMWPLEYMARLVYKGFSYGLKNLKSMQVLVSSGVGTWGPPMRVGTDSEIVVIILG